MSKKLIIIAMFAVLFLAVQSGMAMAGATNLIQNGDFSAGTTDWNVTGDTSFIVPLSDSMALTPGGSYLLVGTSGGTANIDQSIPTVAGNSYTVGYWLANDDESGVNQFQVAWDGSVVSALTLSNAPYSGWTFYSFTAPATGTSSDVMFSFQNDNAAFRLTNVTASVPLPAALLLFGPGLAGIAVVRRKLHK